jgi:hypothetical protein
LVADRLRKDGLNSVDRRRVAIVDMEALQRLGQFQPLIPAPMEEAGT